MTSWVPCPEPGCDLDAEVIEEITFDSTDGPVAYTRTRCPLRHDRYHDRYHDDE